MHALSTPVSVSKSAQQKLRATQPGKVWLVGAGPGAADLLTVKALRCLESADIIFYDQLVSSDIRALFPRHVPALYVGKTKGRHSVTQENLNQMLIDQAQMGLQVCRIKGGDPFVFGRGGEELLALRNAGIDAEVIPGITSAAGCGAAAGIPLTHRGLAQGCTLVTAHGETELNINWQALAQLQHTLVFYMGVSRAQLIRDQLCMAGLSGSTPAAIIENGCRPEQRVLIGELSTLPTLASDNAVRSPALIVVGATVSLAHQLQPENWLASLRQQRLIA